MSKFEEKSDDYYSICPYCGHKYAVESEDYGDQDERQEIYCEECEMKYYLNQDYTITHQTKPDCKLNGQNHNYEFFKNSRHRFCTICGGIEK